MEKTIVQISTPLGTGGISVVRMSGAQCLAIAKKIFNFKSDVHDIKPRHMYYGNINYEGFTEKCLMVYFKSPFSYTGDDVVEFQCHGGEFLTRQILNACLNYGAVLAENGEFTKLAFINGKISLDEAESVIDMINASSTAELKATSRILKGELFDIIKNLQDKIKDAIVNMEVAIDYPEHDEETLKANYLNNILEKCKTELEKLESTANDGLIIKSGINVAIVGKPNVGKSSLINALTKTNRAIVTSVKGTTRDTIEESITYNGFKINFIDTAGIRESDDEVERIGIDRSKESLQNANIVLAVFDASGKLDEEDKEILKLCKDKEVIYIINKIDLSKNKTGLNGIEVSSLNKENIDKIKDEIINETISQKIDFSQVILTNQRHIEVIQQAASLVNKLLKECKTQTIDVLDMQAKLLWQLLGKITGETENEDIISDIFSKFCLGK